MREINNSNIKDILNKILADNDDKSEEFKSGMSCVVQGLNNYINLAPPPFVLSYQFKEFALNKFLNKDSVNLPTFEKLIELFTIKMKQIGRHSTWDVYPEEMDDEVGAMLMECFDGIEILGYSTDFDRQGVTVDLSVYVKNEDGKRATITIGDYSGLTDRGFMPSQNDNNDDLEELTMYLDEDCHYETLFLYICLKKFYQYINPKKVDYLLDMEKNS